MESVSNTSTQGQSAATPSAASHDASYADAAMPIESSDGFDSSDIATESDGQKKTGLPGPVNEASKESKAKQKLARAALENYVAEAVIDGRKMDVSVKDLIDGFQLKQVSHRKLSEADRQLKQVEQIHQNWKSDPETFFRNMGIDVDTFAQNRVAKIIEDMSMDPKDKEIKELKQKAEKYDQVEQTKKVEEEKKVSTARQFQLQKQISDQIAEVMGESWLPKYPELLSDALRIMWQGESRGQRLTPKQAVEILEREKSAHYKHLLTSMPIDKLEKMFPEHFETVRKYQVERARKAGPTPPPKLRGPGDQVPQQANKQPKQMNDKEWRVYWESLKTRS